MTWQPIETAPKDGTVVRLRNSLMTDPEYVRGHFGELVLAATGQAASEPQWVSDWTPDDMFPFPAGRLICPDEWMPDQ